MVVTQLTRTRRPEVATENGSTTRRYGSRLVKTPIGSVVIIGSALCVGACGEGGPGGNNGGDDLVVNISGIAEGDAVTQVEHIEVSATTDGTVTSIRITSPAELVGIDLSSDPAKLVADWDTTLDRNGPTTVTIELQVSGQTYSEQVNVSRSNPSASLSSNYGDGDYVRNGAALIVEVGATAFGTSGSLSGVVVRQASGAGLAPALPIQCLFDSLSTKYDCNIGSPTTSGTASILISAMNASGEYSEPIVLSLPVLENDIVSYHLPYDFEITGSGQAAVVLSKMASNDDQMHMEKISLTDPCNPIQDSTFSVDLGVGDITTLNPELAGKPIGNVMMFGDYAYVLFPSNVFYRVNVATGEKQTLTLTGVVNMESGIGFLHDNRAPYSVVSPNGQYVFATSQTLSVILINAANMYQETGGTTGLNNFTFPASTNPLGFGMMAIHPDSNYVYYTNNWGDYVLTPISAELGVFDISARKFADGIAQTANIDPIAIEPANSSYRVTQHPMVTPNGDFLVIPICDTTLSSTRVRLMDLRSNPKLPSQNANFDLSNYGITGCGTVASISDDSKYILIASTTQNKMMAVIDLLSGQALNISYEAGINDGFFTSGNSAVITENINNTSRSMGVVAFSGSAYAMSLMDVPSSAGLLAPANAEEISYNHLLRSGNFGLQLYAAYTAGSGGTTTLKGGALSVFNIGSNSFCFPSSAQ